MQAKHACQACCAQRPWAHLEEAGTLARSTPCMTSAKKSCRGRPAGGAACTRARTGEKRGACSHQRSTLDSAVRSEPENSAKMVCCNTRLLPRLSWLQVDVPPIDLLTKIVCP